LPLCVFAVVLIGTVVEFLVFWVYFHRRPRRPVAISRRVGLAQPREPLRMKRHSQARRAKPEGVSDLTQLPSAPIGHSQPLPGYPPGGDPSSHQESDDGPSI
jgi:hypothetical protein